ncbi:MAG: hypothetical protein HXS51_12685 [Theionarchaea archaeon]|nr:hypothetical protein [Theionarchaea archaeon]MBU7001618.1 hypothetical protein [Theionarchaea archaeon]
MSSRTGHLILALLVLASLLPSHLLLSESPSHAVIVATPDSLLNHVPGIPVLLVENDTLPESTQFFLTDYVPDILYLLGDVTTDLYAVLSEYGEVVPVTSDELTTLPGKDLTKPHYVVVADPDDPLYPAAQVLASQRGCPVVTVPDDLKEIIQDEWQFMQWEFISSLWGVWEYAMWDKTDDKLQWIGYRYLFTDALFEQDRFRKEMGEASYDFLPEDTLFVAIVGDIGTSMQYWKEGFEAQHILTPTVTSACDSHDILNYRCDYSAFHQKYIAFTSVEGLCPVEELNEVLFQDAPKYWVSSQKEREDLMAMASRYTDLIPCPEVPLSLDYMLAETYAVGRFTGYNLADTLAFMARGLFLPPDGGKYLLANNIEVPVYTEAVLNLLDTAGLTGEYYPLGEAEAGVMAKFDTGIIIYNGTGNSSFFLPHFYKKGEGVATSLSVEVEGIDSHMFMFCPGNGCISFWFPDVTSMYDIKISEGFSQKTWEFTAARPELYVLVNDLKDEHYDLRTTELDTVVLEKVPEIDHYRSPFAYISATGPIGSSEFPLWFIRKGASGFCINVGMQEVLTNFELETLFFSRALGGISTGESLLYAKNAVHTAGYWYPLSGLWMSEEQYVREEASLLFGDPALVLDVTLPLPPVTSLEGLLLDPLTEAQTLKEYLVSMREGCLELGIEIEGINEGISEAESLIASRDPSALEVTQNEYTRVQLLLKTSCQEQLETCEKEIQGNADYQSIFASAERAFGEERYIDCLTLCSQIKGREQNMILLAGGIGLAVIAVILYIVKR